MPLPSKAQNPTGLHCRYEITKIDGEPVDELATYFVLRLDSHGNDPAHINACRAAALQYANTIHEQQSKHLLPIASDLRTLVKFYSQQPYQCHSLTQQLRARGEGDAATTIERLVADEHDHLAEIEVLKRKIAESDARNEGLHNLLMETRRKIVNAAELSEQASQILDTAK